MKNNDYIYLYENKKSYYPGVETLFRPSQKYPEYPFDETCDNNDVYDMVRNLFILRNYDKENINKPCWNPLKGIIKKGDLVVIKPNLVMDYNGNGNPEDVDCLYTHPSVVSAVIDYVIIALDGTGGIIVGDAPMQQCDFDKLINASGYKKLIDYYKDKGINISLLDFRAIRSVNKKTMLISYENDIEEVIVDLKEESEFEELSSEELSRLRVTNYDPRLLCEHQKKGKHEYAISQILLKADVIINMPKPKTHRKAGVTISLKNMIGCNTRKEYLPHHMNGNKRNNKGDEYNNSSLIKRLKSLLLDKKNIAIADNKIKKTYVIHLLIRCCNLLGRLNNDKTYEGSWSGNNTISKTIIDINKIIKYSDQKGILHDDVQRKMLIIADMIVSGEGNGPLCPSSKYLGTIVLGENQVSFDRIVARLMGCCVNKLDTLKQAKDSKSKYLLYSKNECIIISNNEKLNGIKENQLTRDMLWDFKHISEWDSLFID